MGLSVFPNGFRLNGVLAVVSGGMVPAIRFNPAIVGSDIATRVSVAEDRYQ